MLDLSGAWLDWNGLRLEGSRQDGPLTFRSITGWEDPPAVRSGSRPRPNSHGEYAEPGYTAGRVVTVAGACTTQEQRDALLWQLQAAMTPGVTSDLTVNLAGRTLSARARLDRFTPEVAETWAVGVFPWAAQWWCADPLRYGAPIVSAPTGLPVETGGLEFDLFTDGTTDVGYLEFGPAGTSGKVTLANDGTAEAWPVFSVSGTLPDGFELVESYTGSRLRYEGPVTAGGDPVTLDSATGRVRLGSADRGGSLTRAEWWGIPPGGVREVLITSLGSYSADVFLTTTHRPTFW